MAKRPPFKATLSAESIRDLQKQLQEYKTELNGKCDRFVLELAESGIPVLESNISQAGFKYDSNGIESGSDTEHNTYVKVDSLIGMSKATLVVEGREILFIEFGAGVSYNGSVGSSPHPKGEENGFLIGTYGMGHGSQKVWGYYADTGELIMTHGTKATMPMYKASLHIRDEVVRIAKRVFG